MPTSREQKIRLLVLYDLLCRYTDEEHVLSTSEIMEMLVQSGIEVSRNTLYDDINLLNEYGYEVLSYRIAITLLTANLPRQSFLCLQTLSQLQN